MTLTDRARAEAEKRARDYPGDGFEEEAYENGFIDGVEWQAALFHLTAERMAETERAAADELYDIIYGEDDQ